MEAGGATGANLVPSPRPQDSELLIFNLSKNRSWGQELGPGCQQEGAVAGLGPPGSQALGPGAGCALEHGYVEALHSALQILVAVSVEWGLISGGTHRGPRPRPLLHGGPLSPLPGQGALPCPHPGPRG